MDGLLDCFDVEDGMNEGALEGISDGVSLTLRESEYDGDNEGDIDGKFDGLFAKSLSDGMFDGKLLVDGLSDTEPDDGINGVNDGRSSKPVVVGVMDESDGEKIMIGGIERSMIGEFTEGRLLFVGTKFGAMFLSIFVSVFCDVGAMVLDGTRLALEGISTGTVTGEVLMGEKDRSMMGIAGFTIGLGIMSTGTVVLTGTVVTGIIGVGIVATGLPIGVGIIMLTGLAPTAGAPLRFVLDKVDVGVGAGEVVLDAIGEADIDPKGDSDLFGSASVGALVDVAKLAL
jgi:hypothetical protein